MHQTDLQVHVHAYTHKKNHNESLTLVESVTTPLLTVSPLAHNPLTFNSIPANNSFLDMYIPLSICESMTE